MTRILDYAPSDEQSLVSRILLAVHQAADEAFSGNGVKGRNQAKTVLAAKNPAGSVDERGPIPTPATNGAAANLPQDLSSDNSRPHASAFSKVIDDSEFDDIMAEKHKSRKWIFLIIMLATAAFVALALLIGTRGLR